MRESEVFYDYVEEVDPNLTCAICQSALVDPVTTSSCKHTFCRDCITRALKHNSSCPIDRSALTLSSLHDTEPLVQLMLDELHVRCEADGCRKVMQRGLLLAHLRSCSQAIITCGDGDCGLSMARHRMPHHRAYECFHRRMECSRCSVVVTFQQTKQGKHSSCRETDAPDDGERCEFCGDPFTMGAPQHRWTCPSAPVACTHTTRGCASIMPRSELEKHLETCVFEKLSDFFAANNERFKAMEKRQEELVAENEALRSQIWSLRRSISIPRGIWGEGHSDGIQWPEVESTPPSPHSLPPPPLPSVPSAIAIPTSRMTRDDPDATPTATSALAFLGSSSDAVVAPATPVDSISVTTTVSTTSSSAPPSPSTPSMTSPPPIPLSPPLRQRPALPQFPHGLPLQHPRMNYTDWVLQRLPPTHMYPNEACIALHASIIHLAAGLDAAERRNEIRTMTEILRVQEDVATLRAIVSPMRLQVLADRPGSSQRIHRPIQITRASASDHGSLPTPPLSSSHSFLGPDESDDDHLASLSIRESVVFSEQDAGPRIHRSSHSSLVATATAAGSTRPPAAREWTGRPCAFPAEPPQPQQQLRTGRLGSLGRLSASLLGIQRDASPRL